MKLTIYKQKRSKYWYGRTYILKEFNNSNIKKEVFKCSKSTDYKDATKILENWFLDLRYEINHGKFVGNIPLLQIFKKYEEYLRQKLEMREVKNNYYKNFTCHSLPLKRFITKNNIKKFKRKTLSIDYFDFRKSENSNIGKDSLRLEINALRNVMKYAIEHELISNNDLPIYPQFKKQDNKRTFFRLDEYKRLLMNSKRRYADNSISGYKRDKRFQLHQWIVFMTGSGLRVDECKNLLFKDIEIQKDKNKLNLHVIGKTGRRRVITEQSSYHALIKLKEFYLKNGITFHKDAHVFTITHFSVSFRELVKSCELYICKTTGKKRDTKSMRQTYISWEVIKKEKSLVEIALNCGNTVSVIMSNYANNLEHEDFFKERVNAIPFL